MPDQQLALDKYRQKAVTYDESVSLSRLRRRLIARLNLKPGDVVLDVACGTGLNFPLIHEAIGPDGRLIGIDLSPDMLAIAHERVLKNSWKNITLITSSVEAARITEQVDVVLFSFTHDVLRSPQALLNVMRHVKHGGCVVAAGTKWAPWWAVPVNIGVWFRARQYITTFEGFSQPWSHLAPFVTDLQLESFMLGAVYVACGTKSGAA